jgi:asparagine synthase (glutamine-hydrolysing)
MCGIVGFFDPAHGKNQEELLTLARNMTYILDHRGPDYRGVWVDAESGIALGHTRLSIIDLSVAGHQPMVSASGRYILTYNGEIYNFSQIRQKLESEMATASVFTGHSDTEVMLVAFEHWGIQEALHSFNGMFAFALWDRQKRLLHLGRDRLGEKPLYYGWSNKKFFFGSELGAIRCHPDFNSEVDHNALALYLRYSYVPTPYSIYQGIHKLTPGHYLTINGLAPETSDGPVSYWSARDAAEQGLQNTFMGSESEAVSQLDMLLRDSICKRMISDVPLGAFLSGGMDSSTIVALMQAESSRPVKTFSIGMHETGFNEAEFAADIAKHLGTDHTELYVTPKEALDVIPRLHTLYSEPFADSSQIPTFLVSEMARQHVTVSLSGDGGDELFGGYNRYFWAPDIWKKISWIPLLLRKLAAKALRVPSPRQWDHFANLLAPLFKEYGMLGTFGDKFQKLADVMEMPDPDSLYYRLTSQCTHPEELLIKGRESKTIVTDREKWPELKSFVQRMMYFDTVSYLPDDILVKVDRASMGVSLEARIPFLDHRLVEWAWKIPQSMKIKNGAGKWLLRQVLYQYVPKKLVDRPKMGFGIPLASWLRGPLKDWAENLLSEKKLREGGFFQPTIIREKWEEHLKGKRHWHFSLWNVLMFQAWLEANKH